MHSPLIVEEEALTVAEAASRYLPHQGGIELQRDQPAKMHSWHSHSVDETLVVLEGSMVLEYVAVEDGARSVRSSWVGAGARIVLPAKTVHQSTAGGEGCVYFIIPESGMQAETTRYADPEETRVAG
ncbi:hypothetical protein [Nocardia sp. NPDC049149]|uniref:hypothetical protein n=1 Tax=Nocardia sp. NPDC049149 TaxID=3364315 RepID=UPI003713F7C2